MYTRCPQCKTVYPLSAPLISQARGLVQCAQCGRTFNALSFLFDDWPSGQAHGPNPDPDTTAPLLRKVSQAEAGTESMPGTFEPDQTKNDTRRIAWRLATVLLLLVTAANSAWTFREPLLESPGIQALLEQTGWFQHEKESLLRDSQHVQLVSRDMHTHPTRSGILVLSLTFVNLAQDSQEYPVLEITLLDAANQAVARRRLLASEYLRPGTDTKTGLKPDVYLPVLLELVDPGEKAVGFEIQFL